MATSAKKRNPPHRKYVANLQENTHAKEHFNKLAFYGCSPVNLLHIYRNPFYKNTSEGLLLPTAISKDFSPNKLSLELGIC